MLENKISIRKIKKLSEEDLKEVVGGDTSLQDIYLAKNICNQILDTNIEFGGITGILAGTGIGAISGAIVMAMVAKNNNEEEIMGFSALIGAMLGAFFVAPIGMIVGLIGGYINGHIQANKFYKKQIDNKN